MSLPLWRTDESPLTRAWQNEDGSYRQGRPREYRNDPGSSDVISLYPAPDQGSLYPMTPYPPVMTTSVSGSLSDRTYFVRVSFVDSAGNESAASDPAARQFIPANSVLVVAPPQPIIATSATGVNYNTFHVYASETENSELRVTTSAIATSTSWTEPDTGLITSGAAFPTSNDIEPLYGYLIEFRYYKDHTPLTATDDNVQVPDEFRDVLVAGVNWLAWRYKGKHTEASLWERDFQIGLQRIIKNQNPWPSGQRFISPDPVATYYTGGF